MTDTHVDNLINFWQRFAVTKAPFAHPDDLAILRKNDIRYVDDGPTDFESFKLSDRFGNLDDRHFHLSLLPSPYCGNLRSADIFILLLNPGLSFSDYYAETHMRRFRCRLMQTLAQNFDGIEFPFIFLDPEHCWHGGFFWWEKKLREVLRKIAKERFHGKYLAALRDLSSRLASLELVPYHSSSFNADRLINHLPSVRAIKQFAQETLNRHEDKTIIVTRKVKSWGLSGSSDTLISYERRHTQGASLGEKSDGGRAILRRYGIEVAGRFP